MKAKAIGAICCSDFLLFLALPPPSLSHSDSQMPPRRTDGGRSASICVRIGFNGHAAHVRGGSGRKEDADLAALLQELGPSFTLPHSSFSLVLFPLIHALSSTNIDDMMTMIQGKEEVTRKDSSGLVAAGDEDDNGDEF